MMRVKAENLPDQATIAELLQWGQSYLADHNIQSSRREAGLLLAHSMGVPHDKILMGDKRASIRTAPFIQMVLRRAQHEPMAYIIEHKGFWTLDLKVNPSTLIPRPDSEILIESLLKYRPDKTFEYSILDLGTGTGCLLLAALSEYRQASGVGVDRSFNATQLAQANAERNALSDRASFIVGSWVEALKGSFDIILSNPPYIPQKDIETLMPDVRDFEPLSALQGGKDGLEAYRLLFSTLYPFMTKGGIGVFEIGIHQREQVCTLACHYKWRVVDVGHDLGGIARAVVFVKD